MDVLRRPLKDTRNGHVELPIYSCNSTFPWWSSIQAHVLELIESSNHTVYEFANIKHWLQSTLAPPVISLLQRFPEGCISLRWSYKRKQFTGPMITELLFGTLVAETGRVRHTKDATPCCKWARQRRMHVYPPPPTSTSAASVSEELEILGLQPFSRASSL